MKPTRRHLLAGLSALAVAPLLAACGQDETTSGTDEPAAPEAAGAFPVTITHKYGETTLEKAPTRVVCVGLTEQDALLALGIVPVAVTKWFGDAPGYIFSWATDLLGDAELPEVLEDSNGVQVEKVAALAPDLIIGQYSGLTEKDYELLSKIAPTVAQSGDYADYGAPWDEMALTIGKAVGQPDQMQEIVDGVKQQIADAAAANPDFAGRTAMVVTPYEGLFIYGPEDPRSRMLVDLGFEFPTDEFGGEGEEFGTSVSAERTSDLDKIDVAVWLDLEADPAVKKVFDRTTTAAEGRWFDISSDDGDYYVAHSFVTPLSIPYVLERYVPQLAAAVDGDPATEGARTRRLTRPGYTPAEMGTTTGRPLRGSSRTSARRPNTSSSSASVNTSRGGPCRTTAPCFITTTRSLYLAARLRSCSTITTVRPRSRFSRVTRSSTSTWWARSRKVVGSSSRTRSVS